MSITEAVGLHIRKQSGDHADWCYVCGKRSRHGKAEISYPDNAEHGGEAAHYLRICEDCLSDALAVARGERGSIIDSATPL